MGWLESRARSSLFGSITFAHPTPSSPFSSFASSPQGYQLRLFLESFGVRSALLNAELPLNSRSHILQTFNKGLFDYLIATGEAGGRQRGVGFR